MDNKLEVIEPIEVETEDIGTKRERILEPLKNLFIVMNMMNGSNFMYDLNREDEYNDNDRSSRSDIKKLS